MTSMEESWTDWLCDMEPDDYSLFNQSGINVDDESLASQHDIAAVSRDSHCSYATFNTNTMSNSSVGEGSLERPSKLLKTNCSSKTERLSQNQASSPSGSYILWFDNMNPPPPIKIEPEPAALKPKTKVVNSKSEQRRVVQESKKKTGSLSRSGNHTPDHIIAERLRREKISQQFIALSALIPDLKKMDKASVLGDAIKYVKQLTEQVKLMEEQTKSKSVEAVVVVKKSQLSTDEDYVSDTSSNSCNNGNSDDPSKSNLSLPEVEARVSGKNVLIRILCEKEKAVLLNIFREIEKLHLSVVNGSSLSFCSSVLAITILAEMEDQFNVSVQKLAKNLKVGLMQSM